MKSKSLRIIELNRNLLLDGAIPGKALSLIQCSVYVCQATGHQAGGWGPDWADTPWNTRSEKGTRVGYAAIIAYPGGGAFFFFPKVLACDFFFFF